MGVLEKEGTVFRTFSDRYGCISKANRNTDKPAWGHRFPFRQTMTNAVFLSAWKAKSFAEVKSKNAASGAQPPFGLEGKEGSADVSQNHSVKSGKGSPPEGLEGREFRGISTRFGLWAGDDFEPRGGNLPVGWS